MFNLKSKKKPIEVGILQSSKKIIIFPCRITICKNEVVEFSLKRIETEYEILGYINEQTQHKFLYIKRSRKNGNYWSGFIRIPTDVSERLMKTGKLKTSDFEYKFEKL